VLSRGQRGSRAWATAGAGSGTGGLRSLPAKQHAPKARPSRPRSVVRLAVAQVKRDTGASFSWSCMDPDQRRCSAPMPEAAGRAAARWRGRTHPGDQGVVVVAVVLGVPADVVAIWSQPSLLTARNNAWTGQLSCGFAGAPRGIRTPTARSVAWRSASIWSAPDRSGLLTSGASSVQTDPDGSRRIVWMINHGQLDELRDEHQTEADAPPVRAASTGCLPRGYSRPGLGMAVNQSGCWS